MIVDFPIELFFSTEYLLLNSPQMCYLISNLSLLVSNYLQKDEDLFLEYKIE